MELVLKSGTEPMPRLGFHMAGLAHCPRTEGQRIRPLMVKQLHTFRDISWHVALRHTLSFDSVNLGGSLPEDLRYCGYNITPACLRALYDIPKNHVNDPANALGVVEFSPDAYSQVDLNLYFRHFAPYVPNGTHPTLVSIDGGKAPVKPAKAGDESDIDFDLTISLLYPQSVTLYQVGEVSFKSFTNSQLEDQVTFITPFLDGTCL